MFSSFDAYKNGMEDQFNFTKAEWAGLVIAGNISAAISFLSNSFVLFLHAFMLWYKPIIVNRLSLRMIVLSCIFNMIYCACQLVTDNIASTSFTCRALAFVLIASDTMACMCLAMVGLNLVTIFVFKFSRSLKLEIFYYCLILISGVLVIIVPILAGPERGPKYRELETSCWYHFFFDGRMTSLFNWMWYYGWILFSLAFAALCAAVSIRFVLKKQDNFAGTLDMFTRRSKFEISQINTLKRYANNNTDIFTKIARRCICYPLVPLFSKSWGVGIEIAAIKKAYIPYEIFILDRTFSCLLGFMVSCIYFTDPAIGAVLQDFKQGIKKKYVFDYYSVIFQPGSDPTIQSKSQYPQFVSIIPLSSNATPDESFRVRSTYFESQPSTSSNTNLSPFDMSHLHPHMGHLPITFKPEIPTMQVRKSSDEQNDRRYSVVSVTSMTGKIFLPNEVIQENNINNINSNNSNNINQCFKRSNISIIPMRRISDIKKASLGARRHHTAYSKNTETVEMLVPYKFPNAAKSLHWILVSIFRVKQNERRNSNDITPTVQKTRIFHDYTDTSHPSTPVQYEMMTHPTQLINNDDPTSLYTSKSKRSRRGRSGSDGSITLHKLKSRSLDHDSDDDDHIVEHPIRKVSSINVASLYLNRIRGKNVTLSTKNQQGTSERTSSINSSNSKFASSLGLTKLLGHGRSLSFSWGRLTTRTTKKSNISSPVDSSAPISIKDIDTGGLRVKSSNIIETSSDISKAVILAPFSSELSPRPAVQYRKRILKRRIDKSKKKPAPIRKARTLSQIESGISFTDDNDNYLYSLTLLFDGIKNEFEIEEEIYPTADDILQPLSVTFTPTEEESRPVSMELSKVIIDPIQEVVKRKEIEPIKDDHEGFMEGTTTVDYISNWQEGSDIGEASRITVYSEPWDIEEQYKEQMEFTEEILHL